MNDLSSVRVTVNGVSTLRDVIRKDMTMILPTGSTIFDLVNRLEEEFGSKYRAVTGEDLREVIERLFTVTINGKLPTPIRNFDTALRDGDELVFFQWTGA